MKKWLFSMVSSLFIVTVVMATINFSWLPPTEREDNSPIALGEIQGYNIHCGVNLGEYDTILPVSGGDTTSISFEDSELPLGINYCVITTVDTEFRESQYSSVITVEMVLDKANPKPPFVPVGSKITVTVPLP
jgi:hypothetical protein